MSFVVWCWQVISIFIHCSSFVIVENKWNYAAWITGDLFPIKVLLIPNLFIFLKIFTWFKFICTSNSSLCRPYIALQSINLISYPTNNQTDYRTFYQTNYRTDCRTDRWANYWAVDWTNDWISYQKPQQVNYSFQNGYLYFKNAFFDSRGHSIKTLTCEWAKKIWNVWFLV